MKTTIILILAVLLTLSTNLNAQTDQGTIMIGGSVGLMSMTIKNDNTDITTKTTSLELIPRAGFFVADNFSIGVGVGVSSITSKSEHETFDFDSKTVVTGFEFAPFARYHAMLGDHGGIFAHGEISYTSTTTKEDDEKAGNGSELSIGVSPGVIFFPTERLGIEASFGFLGYVSEKDNPEGSDNDVVTNTFGLLLNANTLNFGVHYYIF